MNEDFENDLNQEDPGEETQEIQEDPGEETQEIQEDPGEETQEIQEDPGEETQEIQEDPGTTSQEIQVDYTQNFLILENLGFVQVSMLGALLFYFVLSLVYKFIKSFF
jgi:hypothetical protein